MTDWPHLADWIAAIAQTLAVFAAAWAAWQSQISAKLSAMDSSLRAFLDFSLAYDKIKAKLRPELLKSTKDATTFTRTDFKNEEFQAVEDLIKLFERQHFLIKNKLVSGYLANIWMKGMKKHMRMGAIKFRWLNRKNGKLAIKADISDRFVTFVEHLYREGN